MAIKIILGVIGLFGVLVLLRALILEHIFFAVQSTRIGKTLDCCEPLTMLFLTDLHFRNRLTLKYRKLVAKINQIHPDIILISGDSIDKSGKIEPLEKFLRLLDSQIPKVAILGNHEYQSEVNIQALEDAYEKCNVRLLINETITLSIKNNPLTITGVDDLLKGDADFDEAIKGVGYHPHHFVLIHTPKLQEEIRKKITQLNAERTDSDRLHIYAMFAGHNHGGQVKIGDFVPVLPPDSGDYIEGWYNDSPPYLYVSRGFGTSRLPIRLGARSEITLFEYCTE